MEQDNVALQGSGDDAVHFPYTFGLPGEGEACCFANMVFVDILYQGKYVIRPHAGGNLRDQIGGKGGKGGYISLLCLFKGQHHNFSLAFGSLEIRVHQAEAAVSNCLYPVQMIGAGR